MTGAAEFFGYDEEEVVVNEAFIRRQLEAKRRLLSEAESRLKGMTLQAEAMKRKLADLGGVSIGGIVSRLKGDREARVKELRITFEKFLMEYESAARALSGVQGEVATLERKLATMTQRVMPSKIRPAGAPSPVSRDRAAPSRGARPILCLKPRPV